MFKIFKKKEEESIDTPSILGLRIGHSFEIDSLLLKLRQKETFTDNIASTQIIQAAGVVDWDGTKIFRFYTDDEAFLQVIAEGGSRDEHVVDVKLFHYYDTRDIASNAQWDTLLNTKIGTNTYELDGQEFTRVWTAESDYHKPVHMEETTYDENAETSKTDQFVMLFERMLSDDETESLFLSAEETIDDNNNVEHCFVLSTGITLTPSNITIHG